MEQIVVCSFDTRLHDRNKVNTSFQMSIEIESKVVPSSKVRSSRADLLNASQPAAGTPRRARMRKKTEEEEEK